MQPKLSVIIASYNHQDYIAETLRSLEEQTFEDFEIKNVFLLFWDFCLKFCFFGAARPSSYM